MGYSAELVGESSETVITELRCSRAFSISYRLRYFALSAAELPIPGTTVQDDLARVATAINDFLLNYHATVYGDASLVSATLLDV